MMKGNRTYVYLLSLGLIVISAISGCSSLGFSNPKSDRKAAPVATQETEAVVVAVADTTAPTVVALYPSDSATGVAVNNIVMATFSEGMDPATMVPENCYVLAGETLVAGTVVYNEANRTVIFVPSRNLGGNTTFTVAMTTGIKDAAGNPLAKNLGWNFTTNTIVDATAPAVVSVSPVNDASGVLARSVVTVTFSEAMDPATIDAATFTLKQGSVSVPGTVFFDLSNKRAVFTPTGDLAAGLLHTATIMTGSTDSGGNPLRANLQWSFTPGESSDKLAPSVVSTSPTNAAAGVAVTSILIASFSEAMDTASINAAHFTVSAGMVPIAGTVAYDLPNRTAVFSPSAALDFGTTYTVRVTNGVKDLADNSLVSNKVWTFTTAPAGSGPAPVVLGNSVKFVILSRKAISTAYPSTITGDVGLSPAGESSLTGFVQMDSIGYATSPQVTGFIYSADMAPPARTNMEKVVADMDAAYKDAAGRKNPDFNNLVNGNLGGQTLSPGLYKWESTVTIPSHLTISGGPRDVWIFQITGDLNLGKEVDVVLTGGAMARNIFWQVGGQVSLEAGSRFEGIILGKNGISLGVGSTMNGRALAQGLVALDQAIITKPAP